MCCLFDATNVYLIDLLKEKVVSKGIISNGLYTLKFEEFAVYFSDHQLSTSKDLWHLRFCHANFRVLPNSSQARISV